MNDDSTIVLFPLLTRADRDTWLIMRRDTGGMIRTSGDGVVAVNLLMSGATVGRVRAELAARHGCAPTAIDMSPLIESLAHAQMVQRIDDRIVAAPHVTAEWRRRAVAQARSSMFSAAVRHAPVAWVSRAAYAGRRSNRPLAVQVRDAMMATLALGLATATRLSAINIELVRRNYIDRAIIGVMPVARLDRWFERQTVVRGLPDAGPPSQGTLFCSFHTGAFSLTPFLLARAAGPLTVLVADAEGCADVINRRVDEWRRDGYDCPVRFVSGRPGIRALATDLTAGRSTLVFCDLPGGIDLVRWLRTRSTAVLHPVTMTVTLDGSRTLTVHRAVDTGGALRPLHRLLEAGPEQWLRWHTV